jgi:hypothetical protein
MDWKDLATGLGSVVNIGWIAFAFFVARKALPHLDRIFGNSPLSIKVGPLELSVKKAAESLNKDILDLQKKVSEIEGRIGNVAHPSPSKTDFGLCGSTITLGTMLLRSSA